MYIGEILAGIFGVIIGGAAVALAVTDNLPNLPSLPNVFKIAPQTLRSRSLIAGIGFVLVGLFMIAQGIGYFR